MSTVCQEQFSVMVKSYINQNLIDIIGSVN